MRKTRLIFGGYLLLIVLLFFYSYTQVDLSLTLSRWSVEQVIEKFFQNIGYFQRPFSAFLYTTTILLMYFCYILFLVLAYKKKISKGNVWFLILTTVAILTFSYNAFSYDLFNYIFDAKIFTYYHQNPYFYKALDFPNDPMLSFMHWTHRTYPYGPVWLILTIPLSFIGFNIFLPTLFLFKALASMSFLGTTFFIGKIMKKISKENEILSIVFFALNPLIVIEALVSAHNDIVMIFLSILALYLLMSNKYSRSLIILILSIGVKFATLVLVPVFVLIYFLNKYRENINWNLIFLSTVVLMTVAVIIASFRTAFQPWYLLYALPFAAFIPNRYYIFLPAIIISFFANLQYVPFLYLGNWNNPVPVILFWMTASSIFLSMLLVSAWFLKLHLYNNKAK